MPAPDSDPNSNGLQTVYVLDGSMAVTGAFVCARNMALALAGKARVVLVLPEGSAIGADGTRDFAEVRRLPITHLRRSPRAVALYLPSLFIASLALRTRMRRDNAQVLIVNDFYLMHGAIARLLGFRGRILTWIRIKPGSFGSVSRVWLWAAAKASDRVVSVSRHIAGLLPDRYETVTVYDGIASLCVERGAVEAVAERVFVFLGNYIPGKGQDIAVEAMTLVARECPEARIEFYGGDMGLEKNRSFRRGLEMRARGLGLCGRLHFGDFAADPGAVLRGRFAALNLSQSESFSMTALEASACGLPVIATRSGGPEEIVQDGQTGYLIPLNDVRACADAMIRLCRDPDAARRMGDAGRKRVLSEFSHETFRARLLSLLDLERPAGESHTCAA